MTALTSVVGNVMGLQGAIAGAIVDIETGDCLARAGNAAALSLSLAATIHAQMLRTQMRLVEHQKEKMEDLLITLEKHYHLVRIFRNEDSLPTVFLYLVLERSSANLVMSRRRLAEMEDMVVSDPEAFQEIAATRNALLNHNSIPRVPKSDSVMAVSSTIYPDCTSEEEDEELPPFMRDDVVRKLLGMTPSS